jgi:hypothetical protein
MGYLKIVKLIKMKVRTVAAKGWRVGGGGREDKMGS